MIDGTHLAHWIDSLKLTYLFGIEDGGGKTKTKTTRKRKKKTSTTNDK